MDTPDQDQQSAAINQLVKADNLEALKSMEDNCIDLIYIDPPYYFHSSRKGAFSES